MATKRTYQPSKTRRRRKVGYRARARTQSGQQVLKRRQKHGRKNVSH